MRRKEGFTLVELLLTLGVVAIGLVVLFTLLPGVSRFSREMRDGVRMQRFAEDVFETLRVSITRPAQGEGIPHADLWALDTLVGPRDLQVDGSEGIWPPDPGAELLVPTLVYRIEMSTVSVHQVQAVVEVRSDVQTDFRTFEQMLPLKTEPW